MVQNIISDGGIFNYRDTSGIVVSDGKRILAENNGQMYSFEFYQSSYKSKLYSLLAGLITYKVIVKEYHITSMEIAKRRAPQDCKGRAGTDTKTRCDRN
jgi:hypothetical protein